MRWVGLNLARLDRATIEHIPVSCIYRVTAAQPVFLTAFASISCNSRLVNGSACPFALRGAMTLRSGRSGSDDSRSDGAPWLATDRLFVGRRLDLDTIRGFAVGGLGPR